MIIIIIITMNKYISQYYKKLESITIIKILHNSYNL